jgi:hypothetical protein
VRGDRVTPDGRDAAALEQLDRIRLAKPRKEILSPNWVSGPKIRFRAEVRSLTR